MPLTHEAIIKHLNTTTHKLIPNIQIKSSVTSTNTILIETKPIQNTALFAEEQTAGRGRFDRVWISPPNTNIYFSLAWHFKKAMKEIAGLSVTIGECIARALKQFGITQTITIKWPNDLMHEHKKFGGILIETIPVNTTECIAIIGIGINVNLSAEQGANIDQPWTSLLQITQKNHDRNLLAAALLNALCETLSSTYCSN